MKNSDLAELLTKNQHFKVINPGAVVNEIDISTFETKLQIKLPNQLK